MVTSFTEERQQRLACPDNQHEYAFRVVAQRAVSKVGCYGLRLVEKFM
jgi:hypothetical protein